MTAGVSRSEAIAAALNDWMGEPDVARRMDAAVANWESEHWPTPEQVERAARAIFNYEAAPDLETWDADADEESRNIFRYIAEAALRAAFQDPTLDADGTFSVGDPTLGGTDGA